MADKLNINPVTLDIVKDSLIAVSNGYLIDIIVFIDV